MVQVELCHFVKLSAISSPSPLKFFDLNLKGEVTYYKASGTSDKCNRVGRTMTGDPYKMACRTVRLDSFPLTFEFVT